MTLPLYLGNSCVLKWRGVNRVWHTSSTFMDSEPEQGNSIHYYSMSLGVFEYEHMEATAHVWRSENSMQELVLFPHFCGFRRSNSVHHASPPACWAILLAPIFLLLFISLKCHLLKKKKKEVSAIVHLVVATTIPWLGIFFKLFFSPSLLIHILLFNTEVFIGEDLFWISESPGLY